MNTMEPFLNVKFEFIDTVLLLECPLQVSVGGHAVEAGHVVPGLQPQPQAGEAHIGAVSLEAGQLGRGQGGGHRLREAGGGGGHVVPSEKGETCT